MMVATPSHSHTYGPVQPAGHFVPHRWLLRSWLSLAASGHGAPMNLILFVGLNQGDQVCL